MEIPKNPKRGLKILNSWGKKKMDFVPIDPAGQRVNVYVCGPTVYDSAHLGHARAYLTFDIILRILSDYFGYDIFYVMNITDVDDKIILRARQNYLFDLYLNEATKLSLVLEDMNKALAMVKDKHQMKIQKLQAEIAELGSESVGEDSKGELKQPNQSKDLKESKQSLVEMLDNEMIKLENVTNAEKKAKAFLVDAKSRSMSEKESIEGLLPIVKPELSAMLDKHKGHTVTDQRIFREHAARFEQEFLEDLTSLGVRMPAVLTRVSEYIDEIIQFVQKIIDKGLAYESNGSVYFNVPEFACKHTYCKLKPESAKNIALANEGEGALGSTGEKKTANDFALWKKSKKGEPQWKSPWGLGRPGWHIECSAMSGQILGGNFDIHGGGSDLKFPHHDNEIAQSEAYFDTHQWVNYWMHAGHLHVKGRKMSKSLKNFTTIRAALKAHSARQLRLMFLLAKWDSQINFDENSLKEIEEREKQIKFFFNDAKVALRDRKAPSAETQKWDEKDTQVKDTLLKAKSEVHLALCDNLNWKLAMKKISDLITTGQKYLRSPTFKPLLLRQIQLYVTKMLKIFGLVPSDSVGLRVNGDGATNADGGAASASGNAKEDVIRPYLDAFVEFRNKIRQELKNAGKDAGVDKRVLFKLCDELRDSVLPAIGVRLADKGATSSIWSIDDPKELLEEVQARKREEKAKQVKKLQASIKKKLEEIKQIQDHQIKPEDYFASLHDKKSSFTKIGADGIPTHVKGEPVSKKASKTYAKLLRKYRTNYTKVQSKVAKNPKLVDTLTAEIHRLKAQL